MKKRKQRNGLSRKDGGKQMLTTQVQATESTTAPASGQVAPTSPKKAKHSFGRNNSCTAITAVVPRQRNLHVHDDGIFAF